MTERFSLDRVLDEPAQRVGQLLDVPRRDKQPAVVGDYFNGAADAARHDWHAGPQRLDQRKAERLGLIVGLAIDVRVPQYARHIVGRA